MRDRLIELLQSVPTIDHEGNRGVGNIADYLLENGVIVPPCKVGDMVYKCLFFKNHSSDCVVEHKVVGFHLGNFPDARGGQKRNEYFVVYHEPSNAISHINIRDLNKTVFLSKEDAEEALKEIANT